MSEHTDQEQKAGEKRAGVGTCITQEFQKYLQESIATTVSGHKSPLQDHRTDLL